LELQFEKSPCPVLRRVVREVQNQEQTLEVKLSDGMPDIGRVLCAWGQVILRSKEWRSDSISFSGGIKAWILYAPEDGTDARCVEGWLPFQMNWDLNGNYRDGDIRVNCRLRFVDARSVSARKMMIRAGVAVLGEAFVQDQADIYLPTEVPEDVQLLRSTYPVRLMKEAGEKAFVQDEDLILPASAPVPAKLMYYTARPEVTEKRVTGNRAVFRGTNHLHILYRSEEGQLHTWDFELPYAQYGELQDTYDDQPEIDVAMGITNLELNLDNEGHMRLKCGILGQYLVTDRQMLELIEDAYSTTRTLEPEMEMLELPVQLESRQENIYGEQTIAQDADIVVDTEFLPDFPRSRRRGDHVEWEIPGQFQTLFYGSDGSLQSGSVNWEGQVNIPADENTQLDGDVQIRNRPQSIIGNGNITMKMDGAFHMDTQSSQGIPMVTGLSLREDSGSNMSRPSLILRRAGNDRLWNIAKDSGSTVEAIRRANGLEGEPDMEQILLIPVS